MKNVIIYCLSLSLALPGTLNAQTGMPTESEKIQLATQVVEQLYFTSILEAQIVQAETELKGVKNNGAMDIYQKAQWGATIAFTAAAGYLGWKTKQAKDIRVIWYGLWTLVSGGIAVGTAIDAATAQAVNHVENEAQREAILKDMAEVRVRISDAKNKSAQALNKLRGLDADIDKKVAQALRDSSVQVSKIVEIRTNLGTAESELQTENNDLGLAGFSAAGSLYTLVKAFRTTGPVFEAGSGIGADKAAKFKKWGIILASTGAVVTGAWVAKNVVERKNVVNHINVLKSSLVEVEADYKAALIQSLVGSN